MRWAAIGTAIIAVVVVLVVGGYIGKEMHVRNCLQRVELEYPEAFQANSESKYGTPSLSGEGTFEFFRRSEREEAISSCSHSNWP